MAYIKKINGYSIKDEEARNDIAGIKDGTITVKKAEADADGNNIVNTYATKTENKEAKDKADAAYALAEGKDSAEVFETFEHLTQALIASAKDVYKVGTQLLIEQKKEPDYWVTGTVDTATTSAEGSGDKDANGFYEEYTVGYYKIAMLETAKVDLTGYAEVDGYYENMSVGDADLARTAEKVKQGLKVHILENDQQTTKTFDGSTAIEIGSESTPVLYADRADEAVSATQDGGGNVITTTYAKKTELNAEKITLKVVSEELQILKNDVMITPTT